ncbi:unnamed protein product [Pleuronectes platessa]|uniref:Uncharacterized protein n=1 Tax=Pleuronectes platessa TaxID=8262 RepID=A0A9N7Z742_PLEPL|nr:unnamed protein product [Pleuronectes platessa]
MKKLCCERRVRESITDPEVETTSQYGSSEETVVSERIKSVEEIIEKEVSQFTDVILDVVPDAEYTLLQSQSRLEIKNAADAIVRFAARTAQTESAGTSPERINSPDSVKRRIKNFIVETLEKVANLQAPIFKDLSKKFGSATGLLAAMEAGDPEVEKCIALLLIGHLTKQRGAIASFFI